MRSACPGAAGAVTHCKECVALHIVYKQKAEVGRLGESLGQTGSVVVLTSSEQDVWSVTRVILCVEKCSIEENLYGNFPPFANGE